jgi:hypothetical protein
VATKTRTPTSEVAVTGTWSGTSRHLLLDDHPDSTNPAADVTTCSAAGALVMGFSVFDVPANSTGISVQVLYYDFKNGSQASAAGSLIRCNDTTNRNSAATHNPGNGNAAIALRTDDYTTNPKSGAAWTVDEVNGVGTNGLTAFGVRVTDASPTVAFSSALLQVTYTPPLEAVTGTGALSAADATASGAGTSASTGTGALASTASALSGEGTVEDAPSGSTGTGALSVAAASMAGAGTSSSTGTGAVSASAASLSGEGIVSTAGTGGLIVAAATMSGAGEVTGGQPIQSYWGRSRLKKMIILKKPGENGVRHLSR